MALSGAKKRTKRGRPTLGKGLAAASQNIYTGAALAWNAAGAIVPADDAAGFEFAGIATETYLATTAATEIVFEYGHEEHIAGTFTAADAGSEAVIVDDETIGVASAATFGVRCGRVVELATVDGAAGAWVHVRASAQSVAGQPTTTAPLGPRFVSNIPIGGVAYGSLGTDAAHVAGTVYVAELYLPEPMTATGVAILNGATDGTDLLIGALFSSEGAVLATSDVLGVTSAGADGFQAHDFTAPVALSAGRYLIGAQCDGTTATTRRVAASTYLLATDAIAGSFGTIAAITPPTTFSAGEGPIGYLY